MTAIQIDLWAFITFGVSLLVSFIGAGLAVARYFAAAFERAVAARLGLIEESAKTEAERLRQIEKAFYMLKAEIPREYVRREDYIRGQSVVEAKIDALALKIENLMLKGALK
ncbi:MAG: hypothetical protein LBL48_03855 [Azoarcus sp.]|jgi:hypothetical protein|nr:hypothetical protein [Azoarcus sp.]